MLQGYIKSFITAFDVTLLKMKDVKEVATDLKTDLSSIDDSQINTDEDVIISLLQRLLGSAHYCVCTPKDIETNKYASSDLYHKRLSGCSDLGF